MSVITQTQNHILSTLRTLFGDDVDVDSHPGSWSEEDVRRMIANPPAVYVAWLGAKASDNRYLLKSQWQFYLIANVLDGRNVTMGIYDLLETLCKGINGVAMPPSGEFRLESVQNLWSDEQAGFGVAVYSVIFNATQPLLPMASTTQAPKLAEVTFAKGNLDNHHAVHNPEK